MKISVHSNQFDGRGTGSVPYNYGVGLRNIGHDPIFVTSSLSKNEGLERIMKEFPTVLYDLKVEVNKPEEVRERLERIVNANKIDFMHMIKYGYDDGATPRNCRTGIHCVFNMGFPPHGTVYAGVSEYLAKKYNRQDWVPHIVKREWPKADIREKYGIPKHAIVFGRHGGAEKFDLPFVHWAISGVLKVRKDIWFVFMSTNPFIQHERVIFLPWAKEQQEVTDFIHSCDAMIHARSDGETFGLAVGEFVAANKPVFTWSGLGHDSYDRAHVVQLGSKAIIYDDGPDLLQRLSSIGKGSLQDTNWDVYSEVFSEKNVMDRYSRVFLNT